MRICRICGKEEGGGGGAVIITRCRMSNVRWQGPHPTSCPSPTFSPTTTEKPTHVRGVDPCTGIPRSSVYPEPNNTERVAKEPRPSNPEPRTLNLITLTTNSHKTPSEPNIHLCIPVGTAGPSGTRRSRASGRGTRSTRGGLVLGFGFGYRLPLCVDLRPVV